MTTSDKPIPNTICVVGADGNMGYRNVVCTPTFDEWFIAKYGSTFEEIHMLDGMMINAGMKALTRCMRDYVSEMVQH